MTMKKSNSLKDLKNLSINANEMTSVKGGAWTIGGPGGLSRPTRPTTSYSHIGNYQFG